jgi:cytidylate kinase
MADKKYSVIVTGEWPGAGQSTTAKCLASTLQFKRVYAGLLFRKFAFIWDQEKKQLDWDAFQKAFATNQINLDKYSFSETHFNESILHSFQKELKKAGTPEVWDKVIDRHSLESLLEPDVVVEAKIGVVLDKTGLVKPFKPTHQILKFLLTCPPEVTAERIIKRQMQNGEISTLKKDTPEYKKVLYDMQDNLIKRHLRDWDRYQRIYHIDRDDLYAPDIYQIETATRDEAAVVAEILEIIGQVIG